MVKARIGQSFTKMTLNIGGEAIAHLSQTDGIVFNYIVNLTFKRLNEEWSLRGVAIEFRYFGSWRPTVPHCARVSGLIDPNGVNP